MRDLFVLVLVGALYAVTFTVGVWWAATIVKGVFGL